MQHFLPRGRVTRLFFFHALLLTLNLAAKPLTAQAAPGLPVVRASASAGSFRIASAGTAAPIYVDADDSKTVQLAAQAFAADIARVSGTTPVITNTVDRQTPTILVGTLGHSPVIDHLAASGKLHTAGIKGQWEAAITTVIEHPMPGMARALVIAGSDRRGTAYALFALSRAMGVSPWTWWADVPVRPMPAIYIPAGSFVQHSPSVPYRGIFLNDEDWGMRPWAAKNMDPALNNIGPHTYVRIFELLLRLRANTLWPAMHPGTLAFNAVPANAKLADDWGIVMGSSHSEALLRNNVGEWSEQRDGPWNYQLNAPAINQYWDKRVAVNGGYENFYTVGMRGVHDTGLEATGSDEVKARLVESAMAAQRTILARHLQQPLQQIPEIPQVIWLYKESLALYRAGMQVPDDVTLGWTDDNFGYLRQLPNAQEQKRPGGSGIYYHVSYWGMPHDYLLLCTTPPALIREEMTKAYDHGARRYWILNVGDLKPAEADIDYFMQLGWDEPAMASTSQTAFLASWFAEQLSPSLAQKAAAIMNRYYALNFVRKPEFMGFNGYDDGVNRTAFNPLAWGDENKTRLQAWETLRSTAESLQHEVPADGQDAWFELVGYPVEAAAAQNAKFLWTDRSYLDAFQKNESLAQADSAHAHAAYNRVQTLTAQYNALDHGKWTGMMSASPRDRQVFAMPITATDPGATSPTQLPSAWGAGTSNAHAAPSGIAFGESHGVVSIDAASFTSTHNADNGTWQVQPNLGITGPSVLLAPAGKLSSASATVTEHNPWLSYNFLTADHGNAVLRLHLLPTFAIDSDHRLRYAVSVDGQKPIVMDMSGNGQWREGNAPTWSANVLRNSAIDEISLGHMKAGKHQLHLYFIDPGVVFQSLTIRFASTAPAYPAPPQSILATH